MIQRIIRPAAEQDITDAADFYEGRERGLGVAFLRELSGALSKIGALPLQFPLVWRDARRALLHRFPFAIYFVLRDESTVIVLAVVHQRRHPTLWKARVADETG